MLLNMKCTHTWFHLIKGYYEWVAKSDIYIYIYRYSEVNTYLLKERLMYNLYHELF
jgi:hypothetical protein